jgi:hypothetical protein
VLNFANLKKNRLFEKVRHFRARSLPTGLVAYPNLAVCKVNFMVFLYFLGGRNEVEEPAGCQRPEELRRFLRWTSP